LVPVAVTRKSDDRVVVAVDPHKASWTAAATAMGAAPVRAPLAERPLGNRRSRWSGAPLTTLLRTDGIEVIDVPAKRAARVRVLSSGHGRKNDDADALSVGIAALTSHALGTAEIDAATTALRAVVEHRDG
jgi:transposase